MLTFISSSTIVCTLGSIVAARSLGAKTPRDDSTRSSYGPQRRLGMHPARKALSMRAERFELLPQALNVNNYIQHNTIYHDHTNSSYRILYMTRYIRYVIYAPFARPPPFAPPAREARGCPARRGRFPGNNNTNKNGNSNSNKHSSNNSDSDDNDSSRNSRRLDLVVMLRPTGQPSQGALPNIYIYIYNV